MDLEEFMSEVEEADGWKAFPEPPERIVRGFHEDKKYRVRNNWMHIILGLARIGLNKGYVGTSVSRVYHVLETHLANTDYYNGRSNQIDVALGTRLLEHIKTDIAYRTEES